MTTFFSQDVSCANCHNSSQHDVLGSTSTFGRPDLDLRPAEMQRSTMEVWLQVCPHCRYIAPDLSQQVGDLSVVATAEYGTILADERFPELARRFLAHALLCVASDSARARRHASVPRGFAMMPVKPVWQRNAANSRSSWHPRAGRRRTSLRSNLGPSFRLKRANRKAQLPARGKQV